MKEADKKTPDAEKTPSSTVAKNNRFIIVSVFFVISEGGEGGLSWSCRIERKKKTCKRLSKQILLYQCTRGRRRGERDHHGKCDAPTDSNLDLGGWGYRREGP